MRVLISGATGFIGRALAARLEESGHQVVALTRGPAEGPGAIPWAPMAGELDGALLEGFDGVVHLAGESIGTGRWSRTKKRFIRESRRRGTALLAGVLAGLERPPAVLVSASGANYYGNSGARILTESSAGGGGFLAEVCREWEEATGPARVAGIRVVTPRIGMVLAADGGALARMLPIFRLGGGGRLGSGEQYMSWISREDLVSVIVFLLQEPTLAGAVNAVSPNPVTNREFTAALARALGRPAMVPAPAFALRLALGEVADELLLASVRAVPEKLQASGFAFAEPDLPVALRRIVGE